MTNIFIVEDHEMYREAIRMALETRHPDICVVGEAETGAEFFALIRTATPDLVLLDIALPDMSGIDVARRLKSERPEIKILVLSAENSLSAVKTMLEIDVDGFIGKRYGGFDACAKAIRLVMQGEKFYGKDISEIMYRIFVAKKKTTTISDEFTQQERRIIELSREGLQGKEIADRLGISVKTVYNHRSNIFLKLDVNSALEMVKCAIEKGIIK
ncbi:MAG: response regulator transcription factor [Tannerella sp.]|jgi:DNA-binding NarL/FixJ family response regulator|nr:response regulator transcription factor [Tannerella sp.]